jgi:hypothetical protein
MQGMAKTLLRADNDEALAFFIELSGDLRCPTVVRPLIVAKVAELEELRRLTTEVLSKP